MKICSKCKIEKEFSHFSIREYKNDIPIYRNHCKVCRTNHTMTKVRENPEQTKQKKRESYHKNKEGSLARKKAKYRSNPEPTKIANKKYYELNRDKKLQYAKEYRQSRKEENKEYQANYRIENKELRRKAHYNWEKKELESNPAYRITKNLRNRLRNALHRIGAAKATSAIHKLMKDDLYLMEHFEKQWQPGMTWDNYGDEDNYWNIDHHIPFAYFDDEQLKDPLNQKILNHPINLRPLWAADNLLKSDTIPDDVEFVLNQIKKAIEDESI